MPDRPLTDTELAVLVSDAKAYAYGVDLPDLRWGYTPDADGETPNGAHGGIDAWRDRFKGRADAWTSSKDKPRGSNGERRRASHLGLTSTTPPDFRDALLSIARSAHVLAGAVSVSERNPE